MVTAILLLAPLFGTFGHEIKPPPQPFNDGVKLPGKAMAADNLHGAWRFDYDLEEAPLESGAARLSVVVFLDLADDGRYALNYIARWGELVGIGGSGISIHEKGTYSLSGEMLILDPATTIRSELRDGTVIDDRMVDNEKHVLIAHGERKRLHLAGRCAKYQVDPVCRTSPNIWYSMKPEIGRN